MRLVLGALCLIGLLVSADARTEFFTSNCPTCNPYQDTPTPANVMDLNARRLLIHDRPDMDFNDLEDGIRICDGEWCRTYMRGTDGSWTMVGKYADDGQSPNTPAPYQPDAGGFGGNAGSSGGSGGGNNPGPGWGGNGGSGTGGGSGIQTCAWGGGFNGDCIVTYTP